jgi:hypothetical protein
MVLLDQKWRCRIKWIIPSSQVRMVLLLDQSGGAGTGAGTSGSAGWWIIRIIRIKWKCRIKWIMGLTLVLMVLLDQVEVPEHLEVLDQVVHPGHQDPSGSSGSNWSRWCVRHIRLKWNIRECRIKWIIWD